MHIRRLAGWMVAAAFALLLAIPPLAGRARPLAADSVFINNAGVAGGFQPVPHTYTDIRLGLHLVHPTPPTVTADAAALREVRLVANRDALRWAVGAPNAPHVVYTTQDAPHHVQVYHHDTRRRDLLVARRYDTRLACSPLDPAWCLLYGTRIDNPVDLVNLDTLAVRDFPAIWENPTWSPTALRFAAPNVTIVTGPRTVDEIHVVVVDALTGERVHVCRVGLSARVYFNWSPDGAWLLVHATESLDLDDMPNRTYLFPASYAGGGDCPRFALPAGLPPRAALRMVWATSSGALYLPLDDAAYVYTLAGGGWGRVR